MPGLSKSETARLLAHIEPQGVRVTNVKKGVMLRLPNGDSTVVHYSVSDHRGPQNLKSRLKRAGVTWPMDPNVKRPEKGIPTPHAQELATRAINELGKPERVKAAEMRNLFHEYGWENVTNGTIRRVMIWLGYESHGNTGNLVWIKPRPVRTRQLRALDVMAEVANTPAPEPAPVPEPAPAEARRDETPGAPAEPVETEPTPILPAEPEPETPAASGEREFIDTANSWTVDVEAANLAGMTISDFTAIMRSAGLTVEIRVWHA
jgi:hypothetical protein